MERWAVKVICGVVMLIAMLISFLLPIKLSIYFRRRGDNGQYYLDLLSCFAGGVFLAAYLIFMAPAVRELLVVNIMVPYRIDYPLPDMLIGIGFFILLILNRVVISISEISKKRKVKRAEACNGSSVLVVDVTQPAVVNGSSGNVGLAMVSDDGINHVTPGNRCCTVETQLADMDMLPAVKVHDNGDAFHGLMGNNCAHRLKHDEVTVDLDTDDDLVFQPHSHSPYPLARRSSIAHVAHQDSTMRSIMMMLALSLDSVLEGITTGLKTTTVEVWAIFVGNLVHESVIAFCLGLRLVRVHDGNTRPVLLAAVAYSLMNPVGLAIATIVFETLDTDPRIDLVNGLFQALTSGCFIYVTFCEILEGQITHRTSYMKILCMFAGFALLAAFAVLPGSSAYDIGSLSSCLQNATVSVTTTPTCTPVGR